MFDKFTEECGVFCVFDHHDAANLAYLGLYALQHRGQESAGIASISTDGIKSESNIGTAAGTDGTGERLIARNTPQIHVEKEMGYVADIFTQDRLLRLPGRVALGHVRYSTAGGSLLCNAQPLVASTNKGPVAIAHNGNLVNGKELREKLEKEGAIFNTMTDTEVIVHLIARSPAPDLEGAFTDALSQVRGAFSIIALSPGKVMAARDPRGFRPLVLGRLDQSLCVSSESCAFDLIGATVIREVEPGEILVIESAGADSPTPNRYRTIRRGAAQQQARCVFEHVYFARPDSVIFGKNVGQVRKALGAQLAREHPAEADMVVPVPDSGVFAALGYAHESGIPFEFGLVRNHYVGRTFIEPKQSIRNFGVKVKLNPVREIVTGKRIVLIDDSIVRGTTSRKIVTMLKAAGAKEVHMRISSPPTTGPCYYGIDTPQRQDLIAGSKSIEEIREYIEADSLGYLSAEGMLTAVSNAEEDPRRMYCTACFTGEYHDLATQEPDPVLATTTR
ncbi:MAG TPA: amidophosphoribosyltransferase [Thermoanaerobaculia bacterium]|nr:amidophosphoribosyltransferase [Thermoanaerobaculia bacterium]